MIFIKIKTTVEYLILPSTNTILPKIQNLKRNGLTLQYKKHPIHAFGDYSNAPFVRGAR